MQRTARGVGWGRQEGMWHMHGGMQRVYEPVKGGGGDTEKEEGEERDREHTQTHTYNTDRQENAVYEDRMLIQRMVYGENIGMRQTNRD